MKRVAIGDAGRMAERGLADKKFDDCRTGELGGIEMSLETCEKMAVYSVRE